MRHYRNRRLRIISHEPYPEDMPMPEWARRRELAAAVEQSVRGAVRKADPQQPPSQAAGCINCFHLREGECHNGESEWFHTRPSLPFVCADHEPMVVVPRNCSQCLYCYTYTEHNDYSRCHNPSSAWLDQYRGESSPVCEYFDDDSDDRETVERQRCRNCHYWYSVPPNPSVSCRHEESDRYAVVTPGSTPACAYFVESGEDEDDEDDEDEQELIPGVPPHYPGEPTGCRNCSHWSPNGLRDQASSGLCRCEDSAQWRRLKEPTEMCVQFLAIPARQCGTCRFRYQRGIPGTNEHNRQPIACHHVDSPVVGQAVGMFRSACEHYDAIDP